MDDNSTGIARRDDWFVLVDPQWISCLEHDRTPADKIVGGWKISVDGTIGPFRPNPQYRPSTDTVPTDPVDAVLRRIAAGEHHLREELLATLDHSIVEIGCDHHAHPLTGTTPDGADCIVVATAEIQKHGIDTDRWIPMHGAKLPHILPPDTDIFLNPNGHAPFRLLADTYNKGCR